MQRMRTRILPLTLVLVLVLALGACTVLQSPQERLSGAYTAGAEGDWSQRTYVFDGAWTFTLTLQRVSGETLSLEGTYTVNETEDRLTVILPAAEKETFAETLSSQELLPVEEGEKYIGVLPFENGETYIVIEGLRYEKVGETPSQPTREAPAAEH